MREDLQKRWDILVEYIQDPTRKLQFYNLVEYLRAHTAYFTAPASPKYHCSWPQGLLEHSINVAENALFLRAALPGGENINKEELVIASLFHDLGKAFIEEDQPYYLIKQPSDKQKQYGYVTYPPFEYNQAGAVFLTVPQRSVRLITQFIDISDACYQAILIHDGQYCEENHPYAAKETPFASLLSYADNWAGFHMEGKIVQDDSGKSYKKVYDDKLGKYGTEIRKRVL